MNVLSGDIRRVKKNLSRKFCTEIYFFYKHITLI